MYCATIIWIFFKHVFQMLFPYSVTEILILGFLLRSSISVQVSKKIFEIINKREGIQIIIGVLEKKKNYQGGRAFSSWKNQNVLTCCITGLLQYPLKPSENLLFSDVFWGIYTSFSLFIQLSTLFEHFCKIQIY